MKKDNLDNVDLRSPANFFAEYKLWKEELLSLKNIQSILN